MFNETKHVDLVLFLLQSEAAINLQDEEGFTPLMWAAAHGQIAVVEFLLQSVSAGTRICGHLPYIHELFFLLL